MSLKHLLELTSNCCPDASRLFPLLDAEFLQPATTDRRRKAETVQRLAELLKNKTKQKTCLVQSL